VPFPSSSSPFCSRQGNFRTHTQRVIRDREKKRRQSRIEKKRVDLSFRVFVTSPFDLWDGSCHHAPHAHAPLPRGPSKQAPSTKGTKGQSNAMQSASVLFSVHHSLRRRRMPAGDKCDYRSQLITRPRKCGHRASSPLPPTPLPVPGLWNGEQYGNAFKVWNLERSAGVSEISLTLRCDKISPPTRGCVLS
jgi:hypothetical protein